METVPSQWTTGKTCQKKGKQTLNERLEQYLGSLSIDDALLLQSHLETTDMIKALDDHSPRVEGELSLVEKLIIIWYRDLPEHDQTLVQGFLSAVYA